MSDFGTQGPFSRELSYHGCPLWVESRHWSGACIRVDELHDHLTGGGWTPVDRTSIYAAMFQAPDLFTIIDFYIDELFAPQDDALREAVQSADEKGLPHIQVSPNQGKLLYLIAKMVGARHILEIGTLGGYSAIWLARALPDGGKLITLEADERFARVATESIARANVSEKVELVVGDARTTLPSIIAEAPIPFDLVFLDADKVSYPLYLQLIMQCVRSGSIILADNVIRAGTVLAPRSDDPSADAARAFNKMIAEDDRLEALVLQQVGAKGHDGLAIARVR